MRQGRALLAAVVVVAPGVARGERPVLAGELAYGITGGEVLVHYTTSGADAVPALDSNGDAVPDFVAEVAAEAELAVAHYASLGFRRPVADGVLGGDDRIDVYLRDSIAADGNAGTDTCTGTTCVGFAVAENDYAGFGYPSRTEAIRSVVPHELFHLVQYAYAMDQPSTWTEGTAVWAVEQLYGADNADFERFLPAFLAKTFRPFERPAGGFGDAYPYGAALWPYFLERRFGVDVVRDAWTRCAGAGFLDAIDAALAPHAATLDEAWIEFTRWNAFTGPQAIPAYDEALAWEVAPREPPIDAAGTIYVEGLSARYVPIAAAQRVQLALSAPTGVRVAAWLVADGATVEDGVELAVEDGVVAAIAEPGAYTLVVTGLSRGTITTPVDITLAEPAAGASGCTAAPGASLAPGLLLLRRRRRRLD